MESANCGCYAGRGTRLLAATETFSTVRSVFNGESLSVTLNLTLSSGP